MKKFVLWLAIVMLPVTGIMINQQAANASVSSYTYLQYVQRGDLAVFAVDCHGGLGDGFDNDWHSLSPGQTTKQRCGGNGWIDDAWSPVSYRLHVKNIANSVMTIYPCNTKSSIGGGYYDAWLTRAGC